MPILKGKKQGEFFKIMSPSYRGFSFLDGPTIWFTDAGELRSHTSVPTSITGDGSVIGAVISTGALANLSNLTSPTLVNVDIEPETSGSKDLGDAAKYWRAGYVSTLYLNATASFSGASAGTAALTGNLTISGNLTVTGTPTLGATTWGTDGTGVDLIMYGDTATVYMTWDMDGNTNKGALIFTGATTSPAIQFVNTNVTTSIQTSTDAVVFSATDHASAKIVFGEHTKTHGLDVTLQSVTNGAAVVWDAAAKTFLFDDVTVNFMKTTTNVLSITVNTNNTYFDAGTANDILNFGNTTNIDLLMHGATGGRDCLWDASANSLIMLDNAIFAVGSDRDLQITGNNTTIEINAAAANYVVNWGATAATDLVLHGAGANQDVHWDPSGNVLLWLDSAIIGFGTSTDLYAAYAGGTNILEFTQIAAGTGSITYGADGKGIDTTWFTETASSYIKLDQAAETITAYGVAGFAVANATYTYSLKLSTNSLLLSVTDESAAKLILGTSGTNGMDVTLQSATAGDLVAFDAGAKTLTCIDVGMVLGVNSTNQGQLTIWDGGGGNTPAWILMHSPNGTAYYLFFADDGDLRVHTSAPTATGDGTVVGTQT